MSGDSLALLSFFFSRRRRHTRWSRGWSSDVCSSDLTWEGVRAQEKVLQALGLPTEGLYRATADRKSTRLNSSHGYISDARFCLEKESEGHGGRPRLARKHRRGEGRPAGAR